MDPREDTVVNELGGAVGRNVGEGFMPLCMRA